MIDTINLLWIIPLSSLAGGFVLLVLFLNGMYARMVQRKNVSGGNDNNSDERCASSEHNK